MAEREDTNGLVIAFFETPAEAGDAADSLVEEAGGAGEELHVGILALGDTGLADVMEVGTGGADHPEGVGTVLKVIASLVRGGVVPARHHFLDDDSGITRDDISRIGAELEADHAAVAVLERRPRADSAVVRLTRLGGKTEIHWLSPAALRRAAATPPVAS